MERKEEEDEWQVRGWKMGTKEREKQTEDSHLWRNKRTNHSNNFHCHMHVFVLNSIQTKMYLFLLSALISNHESNKSITTLANKVSKYESQIKSS